MPVMMECSELFLISMRIRTIYPVGGVFISRWAHLSKERRYLKLRRTEIFFEDSKLCWRKNGKICLQTMPFTITWTSVPFLQLVIHHDTAQSVKCFALCFTKYWFCIFVKGEKKWVITFNLCIFAKPYKILLSEALETNS